MINFEVKLDEKGEGRGQRAEGNPISKFKGFKQGHLFSCTTYPEKNIVSFVTNK